jgi:hypothetical protein
MSSKSLFMKSAGGTFVHQFGSAALYSIFSRCQGSMGVYPQRMQILFYGFSVALAFFHALNWT